MTSRSGMPLGEGEAPLDPGWWSILRCAVQHDVLLEDVPTRVAGGAQQREDFGHARGPFSERDVQALPHALCVGEGALAHLRREPRVDVLEVDVPNPGAGVARDRHRIGAAEREVTGVEAKRMSGSLQ